MRYREELVVVDAIQPCKLKELPWWALDAMVKGRWGYHEGDEGFYVNSPEGRERGDSKCWLVRDHNGPYGIDFVLYPGHLFSLVFEPHGEPEEAKL